MKENQASNRKKPNILVRLIALLVTAALLLGALILVVYWDELNLDALKRWFEYRNLQTSETGEAAPFSHAGGEKASFAYLENGVLMASDTGVRYYSFLGELYAEEVCSMDNPVLSTSEACGVVYDAGGRELFVFHQVEEAAHLTLEEELLSARIDDGGWLTVTTHGGGHKGSVKVYDQTYDLEHPRIQINLSTTFVADAALSPDRKMVAVAVLGQEGATFQSQIRFYALDQEEPVAEVSLGNTLVLDLDYEEGMLWVLGEEQVLTVDEEGAVAGVYPFGREYLKGCSFGGDGTALLFLGRYQAGSPERAVLTGPSGEELAELTLSSSVLAFDAAGRYTAVLTGDRLDIYGENLTPYSNLEYTQNSRHVSLSPSGAALLANSQQAWLYLPS